MLHLRRCRYYFGRVILLRSVSYFNTKNGRWVVGGPPLILRRNPPPLSSPNMKFLFTVMGILLDIPIGAKKASKHKGKGSFIYAMGN